MARDHADHLAVDDGRPAAVARVDRGIDLDSQARRAGLEDFVLDARHSSLGGRQAVAADREALNRDSRRDLGELGRTGKGRPLGEECLVLQGQHSQVDSRPDRGHLGLDPVTPPAALNEDLVGVEDQMGIGQDSVSLDDHGAAHHLDGVLLDPRPHGVGQSHLAKHLDDRIG